jgi:hypothetical protein
MGEAGGSQVTSRWTREGGQLPCREKDGRNSQKCHRDPRSSGGSREFDVVGKALGFLALFAPGLALAEGSVRYDKGFVLDAGDAFQLKLGARVQTRYQWLSLDESPDRENRQAFAIQRARIKMEGTVYDPRLTFKYQSDFGKGAVVLKDFMVTFRAADGVELQGGQFKRPYSRHQLTSSGDLALVDRALTDKAVPAGRDVGFQMGSGRKGQPLEWDLGLFNGTGEHFVPEDFGPVLVARVGYNHNKIKGYSEADLEGGPLRFAVAANAHSALNATTDEEATVVAGLDALVKVQGFALLVEGHRDVDAEATALMAQAGYVIAEHYEPVARFAVVMPKEDADRRQELSLGFSVYFFGHNAKWQTDFALLDKDDGEGSTLTDRQLRSQVQLSF